MRNLSLKFTALLGLTLAGCSLKSADDNSSLYVDLSGLRDESSRFALLNPGGGAFPVRRGSSVECRWIQLLRSECHRSGDR